MADYIEPIKIAEMEELTSLDDGVLFIGEDDEDTKKLTFGTLKEYINDKVTIYFGKSSDGKIPPTHDISESAILGEGLLGQMVLGDSAEWELEYPTDLKSDEYVWVSFYIEYPDGTSNWGTTFCLMDQDAKDSILKIQADLQDVHGNLSDLYEAIAEDTESITENQNKILDLQCAIGNLEISNDELKYELSTKAEESDVNKNTDDIETLKNKLDDYESEIVTLKQEIESLMKLIGETSISDMGDGTITGAIDSVRYGHAAPDQN